MANRHQLSEIGGLSEINPHLALAVSESYVSEGERAWERFVRKVERKLGHSLDGTQGIDGYSLDYACDAFDAGVTVDEYVAEVRADQAEIDAAFGPRVEAPR